MAVSAQRPMAVGAQVVLAANILQLRTSGQWRDLLNDADLARYAARVRELASDDLVEWLHREPID